MQELGVDLSQTEYLALQATGTAAWTAAAAAGVDAERIAAKKTERNALYQRYLRTADISIAGVPQVLEQLKAYCQLAIVTTAKQEDFNLIHYGEPTLSSASRDRRGIVSLVELVLTNQDYPRGKPHPDPYLHALDCLGADASNTLVVEDSARGLRAARAAGIDCAVVYHPFTADQDFTHATYQLKRLDELPGLLVKARTE